MTTGLTRTLWRRGATPTIATNEQSSDLFDPNTKEMTPGGRIERFPELHVKTQQQTIGGHEKCKSSQSFGQPCQTRGATCQERRPYRVCGLLWMAAKRLQAIRTAHFSARAGAWHTTCFSQRQSLLAKAAKQLIQLDQLTRQTNSQVTRYFVTRFES